MAKKSWAGNPPTYWLNGPQDAAEVWIEARGYYRNLARRAGEEIETDIESCKRGFDFAEKKLAECRAEMGGPGARLIALDEVWQAIGGRLLSSTGERRLPPDSRLGLLRDTSLGRRIDPEIRDPILTLFGGFARMVRALLPGQSEADKSSAIADMFNEMDQVKAALSELAGLAAASKQHKTRRKGGKKSAETRGTEAEARAKMIAEIASEHPDWSYERIGKKAGCSKATVSRSLKTKPTTDP